jgi:muramoyltetrapeptide carboxypeptidase LdcA involved in peptidoglycan recycling
MAIPPPIIRPPALRSGDTIGIVSPSFAAAGMFRHRLERGIAYLESIGLRVRIAPNALGQRGELSGTAEERAADIHGMFADPDVRGIIAAIGGDHSCHLLPLLDYDLMRANPKVFMGMSDVTVLNLAIHAETGLVTFNGPTLMFALAEYPRTLPYTDHYLRRTLFQAAPVGGIEQAEAWTDEFLDWSTGADLTRPRSLRHSSGWTWLKEGRSAGRLIGGCLESMQHLRGTRWWPDFDDAVLFLETSEEKPSPASIDAMLMDYENMGVLGQIRGLLFANPYGYTDDERLAVRRVILDRCQAFNFPIVTDMDFGHTQPVFTLPMGCMAEIDAGRQWFAIVDAAVS